MHCFLLHVHIVHFFSDVAVEVEMYWSVTAASVGQ